MTGGGGIQPDVIVSSQQFTRLEAVLDESGALTSFATQYLSEHVRVEPTFKITPEILDDFKVFLSARQIQPSVSEWSSERGWIANRLREEIVTQAQGVDKGDEIHAEIDPQVQAALKTLEDNALLASTQ